MPRQAYIHQFIVTGQGSFPTDMLRYDGCFPWNSEALEAMGLGLDHREVRSLGIRSVTLATVGSKEGGPTIERWNSFGWSCRKTYTTKTLT